jgi:hypothetical protein
MRTNSIEKFYGESGRTCGENNSPRVNSNSVDAIIFEAR